MHVPFSLAGMVQLAAVCSHVMAAAPGSEGAALVGQVENMKMINVGKRDTTYTPFNKFFMERFHGDKATAPKPETGVAGEGTSTGQAGPSTQDARKEDKEVSSGSPEKSEKSDSASAPKGETPPEAQPLDTSSGSPKTASNIEVTKVAASVDDTQVGPELSESLLVSGAPVGGNEVAPAALTDSALDTKEASVVKTKEGLPVDTKDVLSVSSKGDPSVNAKDTSVLDTKEEVVKDVPASDGKKASLLETSKVADVSGLEVKDSLKISTKEPLQESPDSTPVTTNKASSENIKDGPTAAKIQQLGEQATQKTNVSPQQTAKEDTPVLTNFHLFTNSSLHVDYVPGNSEKVHEKPKEAQNVNAQSILQSTKSPEMVNSVGLKKAEAQMDKGVNTDREGAESVAADCASGSSCVNVAINQKGSLEALLEAPKKQEPVPDNESTSTTTMTRTTYIYPEDETRTETVRITTTICDENEPCATTAVPKMEAQEDAQNTPANVPNAKEDVPTSTSTTTVTSTLTVESTLTIRSTIIVETCSTKASEATESKVKVIKNGESKPAIVTVPTYQGGASTVAFDVLGAVLGLGVLVFI